MKWLIHLVNIKKRTVLAKRYFSRRGTGHLSSRRLIQRCWNQFEINVNPYKLIKFTFWPLRAPLLAQGWLAAGHLSTVCNCDYLSNTGWDSSSGPLNHLQMTSPVRVRFCVSLFPCRAPFGVLPFPRPKLSLAGDSEKVRFIIRGNIFWECIVDT